MAPNISEVQDPAPDVAEADLLEHAWRYFALHAEQRISVFKFFLAAASLVFAGLAASLQGSGMLLAIGAVLGLILALGAFVFWKLDQRVSTLIKHAARALADLERSFSISSARLFFTEPELTQGAKVMPSAWMGVWTYGSCFRLMFVIVGICGILGSVLCLARLFW